MPWHNGSGGGDDDSEKYVAPDALNDQEAEALPAPTPVDDAVPDGGTP